MGGALVGGIRADQPDAKITVVEPDEARRAELATELPGVSVSEVPTDDPEVVIAVKPDIVESVCRVLGGLGVRRVLSIAAGVTTERIEAALEIDAAVVRAMPNTPALVGEGMAAICAGTRAKPDDLSWASSILGAVGDVVVVDESELDAVTGVSGSGPAYVFLLAEALIDAGVANGLDAATSTRLVEQTLLGASTLLARSVDDAAILRRNVTSPNGTTAAGLEVFAERGFHALIGDVVKAATERSRELGRAQHGH